MQTGSKLRAIHIMRVIINESFFNHCPIPHQKTVPEGRKERAREKREDWDERNIEKMECER
jgi:hypothetical protein